MQNTKCKTSASQMNRVLSCPGSMLLASEEKEKFEKKEKSMYHNPSSAVAELGTSIHKTLEIFTKRARKGNFGSPLVAIHKKHTKKALLDIEEENLLENCSKFLGEYWRNIRYSDQVIPEKRYTCTLKKGLKLTTAADLILVNDYDRMCEIEIIDYKTGSIFVDAFENVQLRAIALVLSKKLDIYKAAVKGRRELVITGTIVNLRFPDHEEFIGSYPISIKEIAQLESALIAIYDDIDPQFVMGDHCRFCPVIFGCKIMKDQIEDVLEAI